MTELKMKTVVGETFEELTVAEMTKVQGFGNASPETTPIY
ncbi:lichenicidin A2 family type 2 lantibiotic [Vagococcus entomophilus]|uniref:Uncharacterized protein n=1 Tax=Vagococcus entomophilus TaxID=1160095 RepID=A0A430AKA3_9ENTE|nr:lichenicidin A2 family type 2 lantibiotic [Vagococcus entomophilus]RSU08489.1 hypothetical protein CBF30_04420 [Vagococcus entomophilus]